MLRLSLRRLRLRYCKCDAEEPASALQPSATFRHPGLRMVQVHQPIPQSTPASPSSARTPQHFLDSTSPVFLGTSTPRLPNSSPAVLYGQGPGPVLTQSTSAVSDASWLPRGRTNLGVRLHHSLADARAGRYRERRRAVLQVMCRVVEEKVVSARPGRHTVCAERFAAAPAKTLHRKCHSGLHVVRSGVPVLNLPRKSCTLRLDGVDSTPRPSRRPSQGSSALSTGIASPQAGGLPPRQDRLHPAATAGFLDLSDWADIGVRRAAVPHPPRPWPTWLQLALACCSMLQSPRRVQEPTVASNGKAPAECANMPSQSCLCS